MARYLLVGALGGPNFGDELILLTWINIIRKRDPAAQIYCDGYNLNELKITVGGLANVVEEDESLWRICFSVNMGHEFNVWESFSIFSRERHEDIYEKLHCLSNKNFDYIQIIGGGYFNNIWKQNYLILAMSRLLSWLTGARLVATGLGLTPTDAVDLPGLRALLSKFDLVDVRDEDSYNLLGGVKLPNLSFTGDDALLSLSDAIGVCSLREIDDQSIILCLQNDLFDGTGSVTEIFTQDVIETLNEHGISNVVFAKAMHDDVSDFASGIKETLEKAGFRISTYEPQELIKFGFPISSCGVIVTSRYHPHFLGALTGARGLALTSMPYYDVKHKAVQNMGGDWRLLNSKDISSLFLQTLRNVLKRETVPARQDVVERFIALKNDLVERIYQDTQPTEEFSLDVLAVWGKLLKERQELKRENNDIVESYKKIVSDYENKLLVCSRENEKIINSFSWKITYPLRFYFSKRYK